MIWRANGEGPGGPQMRKGSPLGNQNNWLTSELFLDEYPRGSGNSPPIGGSA